MECPQRYTTEVSFTTDHEVSNSGGNKKHTIKTTVMVDVNIYSPHIGQSHSVERSMHLWEPSKEMDIQTPHFYITCQLDSSRVFHLRD